MKNLFIYNGFLNGYENCNTDASDYGGYSFYFLKIDYLYDIKKSLEQYFFQEPNTAKVSDAFSLKEIDEKDWIGILKGRCERWFYGNDIKKSKAGFIFRCETDGIEMFVGLLNDFFASMDIKIFEAKGIYWDDVVKQDYIIESEKWLFLLHFAYSE